MFSSLTPPKKAQLRAPLSPLQTAWTDLADNSLGGVECTANHPGSRGVADIVSVTMPLLSLTVAISTRAGPAEDGPPLYKLGPKPVQAVCEGESGALN